jgi:hypothetical protein
MSDPTIAANGKSAGAPVPLRLRFSWALFIACVLSILLVAFVGLLIAFMQYQSRLLRAQPGITAGQLLYYVDIQRALPELNRRLSRQSEELTRLTPLYTLTSNEIEFRVDRICTMFANDPSGNYLRCVLFLKRIPFDGAEPGAQQAMTQPALDAADAGAAPGEVRPLRSEEVDEIQRQFVQLMGDPPIGQVKLSEIIKLYKPDFARLALLNQDFAIRIDPQFKYQYELYKAQCEHYRRLLGTLYYRKFDISACPDEPQAAEQARSALSAPGSSMLGAPVPGPPAQGTPDPVRGAGTTGAPGATVGAAEGAAPGGGAAGTPNPPSQPGEGSPAPPAATDAPLPGGGLPNPPAPSAGSLPAPVPVTSTTSQSDAQRDFELVTHYMFYDKISFDRIQNILISPSEFLALLLVCSSGVLGALLRIVFHTYVSGKPPNGRNVAIGPILGLICALVVYILFRAGFIALTDRPQGADTSTLSPFVIAFVSLAAGLLSERAIDLFRRTSDSWLGSVEASQAARWAVHLQEELDKAGLTIDKLSQRLDVSAEKLREWAEEKSQVPIDKQRDIALVLDRPIRALFTDIAPQAPNA